MNTVRKSFLAFIAIAALYLVCSLLEWTSAVFYLKPLLLVPLMIATFRSPTFLNKKWLFYALSFSWAGDILLLFVYKDGLFFILGLVSFLIAHIFYVILFLKELKKVGGKFQVKLPGLTLIALYIIAFYALLGPRLGDMQIPVVVYAIVISFMLYAAYLLYFKWPKPSSLLLLTGALAFIISDSLLAINKFYAPFPNAGFLVMLTYLYAQGALVWACLGNLSLARNRNLNESGKNIQAVSEPEIAYQKSTLQKFNSFEEMNEADARSAANTEPLDHLKNTTELIKKVYNEELKTQMDKKIKFR